MIKTTENILQEFKDTAFLWKDKETIDITIDVNPKKFIETLVSYKCLKCDGDIMAGNEKLCREVSDDVRGIEITCKSCTQKWFIHEKLVML